MILSSTRLWVCGRCRTERLEPSSAAIPMHNCPGLGMLSVPLIADGDQADVRILEREDYIGEEQGLQMVNGRPIMATETRRPDGSNDVVVYPGVAVGTLRN